MNKIVSNYYLIRLDGEPVYVGYTNRPIEKRFSEHKHDKDFGDVNSTVEKLDELSYDFTWNEELINSYAKEVSARETELINKYGTKDSLWQRGINGNIGGQTWANVKNFVRTNRNNPKFRGLSEESILVYLETSDKVSRYMRGFVNHMDDPVAIYMYDFVHNMEAPVVIYMKNFVNHMDEPVSTYMKSLVNHMDDPVAIYMKNFVNHMDNPIIVYMRSFVSTMHDPVSRYMIDFVNHIEIPTARYMKSFVSNMKKPIDK